MENNELIPVHHFCITHSAELSFIESLQQYGLVELTTIKEETYLPEQQLAALEKFVRMHYELDINIEGIEAISHLLVNLQIRTDAARLLLHRASAMVDDGQPCVREASIANLHATDSAAATSRFARNLEPCRPR